VADDSGPLVWLRLLGGFRLVARGEPIPVRSGGKTEALLVRLGLAGVRGLPREVLLEAIWPHSPSSLGIQALSSLLRGLNATLGQALAGAEPVVATAGQYRLNEAAGIAVDIAQFQAAVAEAEKLQSEDQLTAAVAVFERAASLYAGDLSAAAGSSGRIALERERLRAMYRRVLIRLADEAFARGAFDASLAHALALLAHDPCREDAHRLVMRCHLRLGERSQALHHFQTVREILRVELDTEPEPATFALFEQIRLHPGAV
jgi:DNA-binding SARP family transcriptional activator